MIPDENKKYLFRKDIDHLLLGLILILSWLLSVYHYSGFYMSDDDRYLLNIIAVAKHIFSFESALLPDSYGAMRLGITLPGAFVYWLSGGSVFLTIFHYTIYPPVISFLAYRLSRMIFDSGTGLFASFMIAINSVYYVYAGAILPDNILTITLAITIIILIRFIQCDPELVKKPLLHTGLYGLLIGLSIGSGYLAKESALLILVPVSVFLLIHLRKQGLKSLLVASFTLAAGLVLIFILEMIINSIVIDRYSMRLGVIGSERAVNGYTLRMTQQGVNPVDRAVFVWNSLWPYLNLLFPILLIIFFIYPFRIIRSRNKTTKVPLWIIYVTGLWFVLYQTFGTTSLSTYLPPPIHQPRYYAPFLFFGTLIFADFLVIAIGWLSKLRRSFPSFGLMYGLSFLLLAVWGGNRFFTFSSDAGNIYRTYETKSALMAYQDAMEYPDKEIPVVMSQYLSIRLFPLLLDKDLPHRVKMASRGFNLESEDAPDLPFLFIAPVSNSKKDFSRDYLYEQQCTGTIKITGIKTYKPPRGRLNELKHFLFPLFSSFEYSDNMEFSPGSGHMGLFLIEKSHDSGSMRLEKVNFADLIPLGWCYDQKAIKNRPTCSYEVDDSICVLNLSDSKDVRWTTGKNRAHLLPDSCQSVFMINEPTRIDIFAEMVFDKQVKIHDILLLRFMSGEEKPAIRHIYFYIRGQRAFMDDRICLSPLLNDTAFRIMVRMSGNGRVIIKPK